MRLVAAGAAAAAAAATAVYAGTLECGFVWDDVRAIRGNLDVLVGLRGDLWDLDLLKNDFWGDAMDHDKSHRSYRPLAVWTFRLDAYRGRILDGHGNAYVNPRPFHETNVLLHALASALVGWLCAVMLLAHNEAPEQRRIVANPSNGKKERKRQSSKHIIQSESRHAKEESMDAVALPCTAAALLFAVHSIHTEAVAGLVGRADILASIFFILAIGVYERYRIASVAAALAMVSTLCKETGLTALGYCIFSELLSWRGKPSAARVAMLVAVVAMALRTRLALHQGKGLYAWTVMENHIALEPSLWTRICSYAHTHALYLKLLFYPRGLSYHHGFGTVPLLESPSPLSVCAYALLLLVCTLAMVWRDKRLARILALSLLPFVPASNVLFPIGAILAERLLYIPSVGACALLALVLHRSRHAWTRTYRVLCLFLAVYISFLSVWTVERNKDWMSDVTLFEAGLREHPTNIGALSNVGYMYMQDGSNHTKLVTARELFLRATSLHPRFATAWLNLSVVARKLGNDTEAMHALRELLSLDPEHCRGKASLADILVSRVEIAQGGAEPSQVQEAMEAAEHASINCPKIPLAHYALARLLVLKANESDEIDHAKEALATFEEALRRSDDLPLDSPEKLVHGNVLNEMALFARARDDTQTALTLWERAQAIRNVSGAVLSNAAVQGWLHAVRTYGADNVKFTFPNGTEISGLERAQELMARALEAEPNNGLVMANAGWLHEVQGNLLTAQQLYMDAQKLAGNHPSIMDSLKRVQDLLVAEENAPVESL